MTNTTRKWGYRPDLMDFRDYAFAEKVSKPVPLPAIVSLRSKMAPVFDQGDLGSCTANALAMALAFEHGGGPYSRLQIYYDERVIEKTVSQDSGAQIRDGVKVLTNTGGGPESEWPYVVSKFAHAPPAKELTAAGLDKISVYSRLTTGADFHQCLAQGFPFVIGFTVYESFESDAVAKTGIVPMPGKKEAVAGGHAVCVIGYDDTRKFYEARNSWSETWGDAGNFWIPQAYFENTNLADDAWTIRK